MPTEIIPKLSIAEWNLKIKEFQDYRDKQIEDEKEDKLSEVTKILNDYNITIDEVQKKLLSNKADTKVEPAKKARKQSAPVLVKYILGGIKWKNRGVTPELIDKYLKVEGNKKEDLLVNLDGHYINDDQGRIESFLSSN